MGGADVIDRRHGRDGSGSMEVGLLPRGGEVAEPNIGGGSERGREGIRVGTGGDRGGRRRGRSQVGRRFGLKSG